MQIDPRVDSWVLPHSCGDVCGRKLLPECGHECLLLCHPGMEGVVRCHHMCGWFCYQDPVHLVQ